MTISWLFWLGGFYLGPSYRVAAKLPAPHQTCTAYYLIIRNVPFGRRQNYPRESNHVWLLLFGGRCRCALRFTRHQLPKRGGGTATVCAPEAAPEAAPESSQCRRLRRGKLSSPFFSSASSLSMKARLRFVTPKLFKSSPAERSYSSADSARGC